MASDRQLVAAQEAPLDGEGRIVCFRAQDGLTLAARVFGEHRPRRLPVLCLAGMSRNSSDFVLLGQYLSERAHDPRQVFALDYRGRGLSDADRNWRNYTPLAEAQDAIVAAAVLGIERAVVVGTSRGGIIAMILGALRPGLLAGVVLNDIVPVIEGTGLARIKKYLSQRGRPSGWDEAVAGLRKVQSAHFPALAEDDWQALARATYAQTNGGLSPRFDPNLLRMVAGIDLEEAIPVLWAQFGTLASVPVLSIRGECSDILSAETVAAMAARHPHFERLTVPGQGHAPLLRDEPTLERIAAFARRCETRAG